MHAGGVTAAAAELSVAEFVSYILYGAATRKLPDNP